MLQEPPSFLGGGYGLHASLILLPPIPGEAIEAIAITWTTFLHRLLIRPLLSVRSISEEMT